VENTGIAFSFKVPFLEITTIVLIIGIFYYYIKEKKLYKNKFLTDLSF
jgi:lipoprotein signal peptidase